MNKRTYDEQVDYVYDAMDKFTEFSSFKAQREKYRAFSVILILPNSIEVKDKTKGFSTKSIVFGDHEYMERQLKEQMKPDLQISADVGKFINTIIFPDILTSIFCENYDDFRKYHPFGVGFYQKPMRRFLDKANADGSPNLRLEDETDYPRIFFTIFAKSKTPCGINIIKKFKNVRFKNSEIECKSIKQFDIQEIDNDILSIANKMHENVPCLFGNSDELVSNDGKIRFLYFMSPPTKENFLNYLGEINALKHMVYNKTCEEEPSIAPDIENFHLKPKLTVEKAAYL